MALLDNIKTKRQKNRINKLIEKIHAMEHEIAPWVIKNLKNYSPQEITEALYKTYNELESYMQKKMLFHLDRSGYLGYIYGKLDEGSEEEMLFSLEVLRYLRPPKALPLVLNKFADRKAVISFAVVEVLIAYQDKKIIDALISQIRDDGIYLPARIAEVLQGYGSLAVDELMRNLDNDDLNKEQIIEILTQFNDERINENIKKYVQHEDAKVRLSAIRFFLKREDPGSVEIFKEALNDEDIYVRKQAEIGIENAEYDFVK